MKQIFKNILRFLGVIIRNQNDLNIIKDLKEVFIHNDRSFNYGFGKYLVDSLYCHASPGVIETIIEIVEDFPRSKKILNLGGGSGQVSSIFQKMGFDVYNLDINIEKENQKNINFDLNSIKDIPFPSNYFDIIICQEVIEHIENPWKMFRDVNRLLKMDGVLILSTPNILSIQSRIRFFLEGYFQWFTPKCFDYHINPISWWEIDLISKRNKFKIEKIMGSGNYYFNKNINFKKTILNNESLIYILKKEKI